MRFNLNIALMLGLVFSYNSHGINATHTNNPSNTSDKTIDLKDFDLSAETQRSKKSKSLHKKIMPLHFDRYLNKQTFIWSEKTNTYGGAQQSLMTSKKATAPIKKSTSSISDIDLAREYLHSYIPQRKVARTTDKNDQPNSEIYVSSNHTSSKFGPAIVKFRQKYNGVDVFAREANVLMDKNKELVAISGYLSTSEPTLSSDTQQKSSDLALNAIRIAFEDMGIQTQLVLNEEKTKYNKSLTTTEHLQIATVVTLLSVVH